jgi:folate-dependent phosphoribosylglycinamide formyltransferase PurN
VKVAIFCKGYCGLSVAILKRFFADGQKIDLVVIERDERNTFSKNEILNRRALRSYVFDRFWNLLSRMEFAKLKSELRSLLSGVVRLVWWLQPKAFRQFIMLQAHKLPIFRKSSTALIGGSLGVPVHYVDRHSSKETVDLLNRYEIDFIVNGSSGWLYKEPLFSETKARILSCHGSELPKHRGLDAAFWSLYNGDPLGLTAFMINAGLDTGEILQFMPLPEGRSSNILQLRDRVEAMQPDLYVDVVGKLSRSELQPLVQKEGIDTYNNPMTYPELLTAQKILDAKQS